MENEKLLPCPFCGGTSLQRICEQSRNFYLYFVRCTTCDTKGPVTMSMNYLDPIKRNKSIKDWNTRHVTIS